MEARPCRRSCRCCATDRGIRATVTRSAEFREKYLAYRESNRPSPPEKPKSMEQTRREAKEQLKSSIAETEKMMQSMPADQQAGMREAVKSMKEQLKSYDDPNNPMFSPQVEEYQQSANAAALEEHKTKLSEWEKQYPQNPNAMVQRWLSEFLEVSKDIKFDAKLIDGDGGKKMFAETQYERKSSQWKMCFRAGRQTIDASRMFAEQWLTELNKTR